MNTEEIKETEVVGEAKSIVEEAEPTEETLLLENPEEQTAEATISEVAVLPTKPPIEKKLILLMLGVAILVAVFSFVLGTVNGNNKAIAEERLQQDQVYQSKKAEIETMDTVIAALKDYSIKRKDLDEKLSSDTAKVTELDKQIATKQAKLDQLTGQVNTELSKPTKLSSGEFYVGQDIEPGRYQVSGSSNFVVRNSKGGLKVNTILGDSIVGRGDYICTLDTGDIIKNEAPATFTPVK